MITGVIGGAIIALMPLVARDLLGGGAQIYGIALSAFGLGAVIGALYVPLVRKSLSGEAAIRACALSMSGTLLAVALSHELILTSAALVLTWAVWMISWALFNIGVQLSAPRWVAGRSLAAYRSEDAEALAHPDVRLALTHRSGPVVIEIEFRVAQENAPAFHNVMQDVQLFRKRNGAYGWSIARDIADPELWTERYIARRGLIIYANARSTHSERALDRQAASFHVGPEPVRIRRMLERPFGSVRWKDDVPDCTANEFLLGDYNRNRT
ncbi:MFS transporter [Bradyrhizobium sp. 179]|uniref:MFS transporter n=1 Tax=Bradyrhizobium sp. 179 TaxID=2782648 RepID=UPI00209825DE|nr:MFS transporter [Bradyrhizobium sp. 179]